MGKKSEGIMSIVAPKPKGDKSKRGDKMPKEERKVDKELERKG